MTISLSDSHFICYSGQKKNRQECLAGWICLFDFLLQIVKEFAIEKLSEADFKSIA